MATVLTAPRPTTKPGELQRWPPPQGQWTYKDYLRLPDHNGVRYEIIKGDLSMVPAPRPVHQRSVAVLFGNLWDFLQEEPAGEVFISPIDVRLPDLLDPVQPDLLFITAGHLDIVGETAIEGAPDLIIEVLSHSNPSHDRRTKFFAYAEAGVREYWIVDPDRRAIDIYVLRGQAYAPLGRFEADDQTRSEVLPGFSVRVGNVCR